MKTNLLRIENPRFASPLRRVSGSHSGNTSKNIARYWASCGCLNGYELRAHCGILKCLWKFVELMNKVKQITSL